MRAVLQAGGDSRQSWPVQRFLDTADRAVGHPILGPLYREMGLARHAIDLDRLWRDLGVHIDGHRLSFDDSAPEAWMRKAITAPPTGRP